MLDTVMLVLATLVGAIGFWLRGSALFFQLTGRGATTARVVCWSLPVALLTLVYVSPLIALSLGVGLFIGTVFPWWRSLSLGRNPADGTWTQAALRHTTRGLLWTVFAAAVVWYAGGYWVLPVIAGLLCAVPYEIGWRIGNCYRFSATEIGELGFGAMISVSIILALM